MEGVLIDEITKVCTKETHPMQRLPHFVALAAASALTTTVFTAVSAVAGGHAQHHAATQHHASTIVDAAAASVEHSTLVAAVKAAGLAETLSGQGPFTVFAPTNSAFAKLPEGTVETLLKSENRDTLAKVLTYHVVPGKVTADQLIGLIQESGGAAALMTVEGGTLTARLKDGNVVLEDKKGGMATVRQADLMQSNGVIHVTDTVSMPG
jgi:uncharacterized surface protein with fasciclin (FAS1) repeats